jgi:hypothetical protein
VDSLSPSLEARYANVTRVIALSFLVPL